MWYCRGLDLIVWMKRQWDKGGLKAFEGGGEGWSRDEVMMAAPANTIGQGRSNCRGESSFPAIRSIDIRHIESRDMLRLGGAEIVWKLWW